MIIAWGTKETPEIRDGIARFVGSRVEGGHRGFGECVAMGVISQNRLLCGLIYHNYNPEAGVIEISGASDSSQWLTRQTLWAMYSYPFNEAGCQLVVQRSSEKNRMWNGRGIRRMLTAYGFAETRIKRLRGRDADELIFTLTDDAWASNGFHREHAKESRAAA